MASANLGTMLVVLLRMHSTLSLRSAYHKSIEALAQTNRYLKLCALEASGVKEEDLKGERFSGHDRSSQGVPIVGQE